MENLIVHGYQKQQNSVFLAQALQMWMHISVWEKERLILASFQRAG